MTNKQIAKGGNKSLTRPVWRVRRKDDPERWLRSFHREDEARAFARQHAIENGCSMLIERPTQAAIDEWWEF